MKIIHSGIDVASGLYRVVVQGDTDGVAAGIGLRCGAYRFIVTEVIERYENLGRAVCVLVEGRNAPSDGMVLHLSSEPLTEEELSSALRHLVMVSRLLMTIDASLVSLAAERYAGTLELGPSELKLIGRVQDIARAVAEATSKLPPLVDIFEVERYLSELVGGLKRAVS